MSPPRTRQGPGAAAPGRGRPVMNYLGILLRDVPGRHVRQPVPGHGARDGAGRQRRPGRVDERRRGPHVPQHVAPARVGPRSAEALNAFLSFAVGGQPTVRLLGRQRRGHPGEVDDPAGPVARAPGHLQTRPFTYATLVSAMNGWLTTTEPARLQRLDVRRGGAASAVGAQRPRRRADCVHPRRFRNLHHQSAGCRSAGVGELQLPEPAGFAVECAESPNPRHPASSWCSMPSPIARAGDIGRAWSGLDEPCASWPATAADRYAGPWDRPTANPILVIGNTFDPVTPYKGAVAMATELARARLLTVDGYGHTVLLNPSPCAAQYEIDYLVDGTLPPQGTVCPSTSSRSLRLLSNRTDESSEVKCRGESLCKHGANERRRTGREGTHRSIHGGRRSPWRTTSRHERRHGTTWRPRAS